MEVYYALIAVALLVFALYVALDGLVKWFYDENFDDEHDEAEDYFDPMDTVGELMYRLKKVDHLMHSPLHTP